MINNDIILMGRSVLGTKINCLQLAFSSLVRWPYILTDTLMPKHLYGQREIGLR